jgi:hypothetical protein
MIRIIGLQVRALPGACLSIKHLWTKPCITWATCLDTSQNRFLSHEPRYLPFETRAFGNTRRGKYRGSSSPNSVTQSGDPELRTQIRSRSFAMFAHCLHVSSLQTGAFPYDVKGQTANDERPRFLPFRESERSRHPLHDDQLP